MENTDSHIRVLSQIAPKMDGKYVAMSNNRAGDGDSKRAWIVRLLPVLIPGITLAAMILLHGWREG